MKVLEVSVFSCGSELMNLSCILALYNMLSQKFTFLSIAIARNCLLRTYVVDLCSEGMSNLPSECIVYFYFLFGETARAARTN